MRDFGVLLFAFFATAWVHGAVAFVAVRGLVAARVLRSAATREMAWRAVVLLPFATAAVQLVAQDVLVAQRWSAVRAAQGVGEIVAKAAQPDAGSIPVEVDAVRRDAAAPVVPVGADDTRSATRNVVNAAVSGSAALADAAAIAPAAGEPAPRSTVRDLIAAWIPGDTYTALAALGWLWLALAIAAVLRFGTAVALAARRADRLPAIDDTDVIAAATRIAKALRVRPIALHRDDRLDSPLALAPHHVCVPGWMLESLGPAQRDAMLTHEIAHHARRDPWWRLAQRVARAATPARGARHACRQLDDFAELACDAHAATLAGNGRALAECLALCAERGCQDQPHAVAVAMAHARSPLLQRVRRLLEDKPMPADSFSRARAALLLVAATAAAVVLPGFSGAVIADAAAAGSSLHISTDDNRSTEISQGRSWWSGQNETRIRVEEDNGYEFKLDATGDFKFSADETDLVELQDELIIEEKRDGVKRRIDLKRNGGEIERTYYVDGDEQPYDAAAKQWFAQLVPQVYRQTGMDAQGRVDRIHARGGADGVLAEVDLIGSDYVRGEYLGFLFAKGGLSDAQLARAVAAIGKFNSDYSRRTALVTALESQRLDAATQIAMLGIAADFGSDYERRELLAAAAKVLIDEPRVHEAWFDALDHGDSDYERRTALEAWFEREDDDAALMARALASTRKFSSDYERRTALEHAAPLLHDRDALVRAYAQSAQGIDSDYDRRLAIQVAIGDAVLSVDGARALLSATDGMSSDYDIRNVLESLAARMPADADLIAQYRGVARRLGDYERGQAEKALDRFAML